MDYRVSVSWSERAKAMSAAHVEQRLEPIHAVRPESPGRDVSSIADRTPGRPADSSSYLLTMALVGFTWILACVALFGWVIISVTG